MKQLLLIVILSAVSLSTAQAQDEAKIYQTKFAPIASKTLTVTKDGVAFTTVNVPRGAELSITHQGENPDQNQATRSRARTLKGDLTIVITNDGEELMRMKVDNAEATVLWPHSNRPALEPRGL